MRGYWGLGMVLAVLAARPAAAQAVAPPADGMVAEVVALVQSGDAAARGAFLGRVLSRTADSARIDQLLARLHEQGAPFEVAPREPFGRSSFARLTSPRARRTATIQLSTDRQEPGRLGQIGILESHATVLDSIQWPATHDLVPLVRANLGRLTRADAFSGVVYIARGDSVLLEEGFGLADREDSVANTGRTRFALASMGKMFTATAILQLVDAGKLRLDDTLARVLPAYPNRERAGRVTIRQLLEHTAGMGDQWSTPKRPVPGLTGQLARAAAVAHAPLLFEPGTRWSYSNEGYTVLGAVVEEVSGMTFHAYLRRHVLEPAGMTETEVASGADDIIPRRAVGYRPRADDALGSGPPRANWSFLGADGMGGAGGGYSTARDLARFGRALRTGALVSPTLRDSMWTGRWPVPGYPGEKYGWGSFVGPAGEHVAVGHGGGGGGSGMDNGFRQLTDGAYTVVVLTNIDPPVATELTRALVRLVAALPAP